MKYYRFNLILKRAILFLFIFAIKISVVRGEPLKPLSNPLFFSISKEGVTSYIFGTIHLGISFHELPNVVFEELDKSRFFVAEKIFSKKDSVAGGSETQIKRIDSFPVRPSDLTIQKLLKRGIPGSVLERPSTNLCLWYAALEPLLLLSEEGGLIDELLEQKAIEKGHLLVELDQNRQQKNEISKKVTNQCDINHYVEVTSEDRARESVDQIIQKYRNGDLKDFSDGDHGGDLTEVEQRNRSWIEILAGPLRQGAFIVVGAGHLGGEKGLLTLLSKKGYVIDRIHVKDPIESKERSN